MNKVAGFTLAEVLITLGIIGTVAAMTIPTLMQNIQDNEFKTQMRKEYSVLSEAFQLIKQENGKFEDALANAPGSYVSAQFKNVFKTKLSYIKECDINNGSNLGVCVSAQSDIKWLNKQPADDTFVGNSYTAGLVLKDGASLNFDRDASICQQVVPSYNNRCGWISVDVNGLKPPNTFGRDIYIFMVFSDAMRPTIPNVTTSSITSDDCGVGANYGFTCSSKYLLGN